MEWALSDFAAPIQKCTSAYTMVELQVYKYPLHTGITECFLLKNCSRVASRVTKTTQSVELQVYKYPLHTDITEHFLLNNCS
jgi:4-hydroxy-3-methylbut-2-en-1-yl diphosphate synthase IspG/GcpE